MKHFFVKKAIIALFLLGFSNLNFAQTKDNFIKIIGNSKREYTADGLMLILNVIEIQPNEYRQVRYKPIETVLQNVVASLATLGFKESDLKKEVQPNTGGYQAFKSERHSLVISPEQLAKITKLEMEGVQIAEIRYLYKAPGVEAEEQLAVAAIKDAERKAKNIAKEIGKKVGKIINIDDKSGGCCRDLENVKDKTASHTYKVNVTFELLD